MEDSKFLYHTNCEKCGSSDARAVYSNGSSFCFSCQSWEGDSEGEVKKISVKNFNLLKDVQCKPLIKRKINEETARKYNYGYATYNGQKVHVATYRNSKGEIVAQHTRTSDKQFRWIGDVSDLQLFGQHLWRNGGKRLVITEGEIDCLTISQMFNNKWAVVSLPSGAQSAVKYIKMNLEFIESYNEVVLAFDNDEAGRAATEKVAQVISAGKVKVATFNNYKDANDMLKAAEGHKIAPAIFEAREYRPDGIVGGHDLTVDDLLKQDDVKGYDLINFPELSQALRGIRKGELTTVTAGSGIGKSTFVKMVAHELITRHSLKVGYIALEESLKKSILGLMAVELGVSLGDLFLNRQCVPEDEFKTAYKKVIENGNTFFFDSFGSMDSSNLISKIKYLASGLDVDFIVLDHISIVVSGMDNKGNERELIDYLMTELRTVVEQSGVGMILISHLKKAGSKKKSFEEGGQISGDDLRGSAGLKQLSDNIIAIERDQQDEENKNISRLRLLKCRLFGENVGVADGCKYENGRLTAWHGQIVEDFSNAILNQEEEF